MRQYTHVGDSGVDATPPAHGGAGRGLTERHWRLLALIARYGVLDTRQVTTLMFDSRPTAARHLHVLVKAGLVQRFVDSRDPTHLARYEVSNAGAELLAGRLQQAGQPVPVGLGVRGHGDEAIVNDFFVRLIGHARRTGRGHLYRWRHALDTAVWLRSHGGLHVDASGYGMWIEDDLAVGFLLHVDDDRTVPILNISPPPPVVLLSGYQQAASGVPVDVALVITPTTQRERQLHRDTPRLRLPVRVAATTTNRLSEAASPAEEIWSSAGTDHLARLVDLGRPTTAGPPC